MHYLAQLKQQQEDAVQDRLIRRSTGAGVVFVNVRLSPNYSVAVVHELLLSNQWAFWGARNQHLIPIISVLTLLILVSIYLLYVDTRKRRSAEKKLELSYAALAQLPVMVVITDANYTITYVNATFERQMLYRADDLMGHPLCIIDDKHLSPFKEAGHKLQPNTNWVREFLTQRSDGQSIYVRCRLSPVSGVNKKTTHFVGILTDISKHKQDEKEIRIAATAFNVQTGMIVTDDLGYILRVNPALLSMLGIEERALIDQPIGYLFHEKTQSDYSFTDIVKALEARGHWEGEIGLRKPNGGLISALVNCNPVLNEVGKAGNFVIAITDITARIKAEEQATHLAYYDALTALPNRRLFNDRMPHAIKTSRRTGQYGALMVIDLDHFKTINDTQGHDVGDGVLVESAARLTKSLRDTDTVIRMGGDEFLVLLENIGATHEGAAIQTELVATKLNQAIAQTFNVQGHMFQ
ncbi:MAG: diguanylate cyclase domain-containing protein, partial [Pontibacterium sp.]